MLTSVMPFVKVQDFDSEVSKFRRLNERLTLKNGDLSQS